MPAAPPDHDAPTLVPANADVHALQLQLSSLQLSLDSNRNSTPDLRRMTEVSLCSIAAQFSPVLPSLPSVSYLKDTSGRYIYVSELWEKVFGKTLGDWYNKTDADLWGPAVAATQQQTDAQVLRTLLPVQMEETLIVDEVESYWLFTKFPVGNTSSQPSAYVGCVAVDITQRKAAEAALAASENRYRDLFNSVLTGIYRAGVDGSIVLANPAFIRMLGYDSIDDLKGARHHRLYPNSDGKARFWEVMARDGQVLGLESVWLRKDGTPLQVRETARAALDANGRVTCYEGVIEDISHQRRAELLERDRNHILELVARNEPLRKILEELCLLVERQHPGGLCSVMLREGDTLQCYAAPSLPRGWRRLLSEGVPVSPQSGSCGAAAHLGESIVAADILTDPRWEDYRRMGVRNGLRSCWSNPIFSGTNRVLGTFAVYHTTPHEPSLAETELLLATSRMAAVAIEHRQLYEELEHQAKYDALTELPNRRLFSERLEDALAEARWNQHSLALLWIDLDRFKEVNDTLGHRIGDLLLVAVTARLKESLQNNELLARTGGDEFAVLLPFIPNGASALACAQRILDDLQRPFNVEEYDLFVSASIGICTYPEHGLDSATLQRNADGAMYRVKAQGRNGYHCYEPQIGATALYRLELENSLRKALDLNQLELFYQPQTDTLGNVLGAEALLRWNHPRHGLMSPALFMDLAEESGLIVPIGTWVVQQACRQIAEWKRLGYPEVKVAVNVSPLQIYYADFADIVKSALLACDVQPNLLEIELTESMLVRNLDECIRQIERLRTLGVTIAIDDFGTGYSSLSYLQKLPVDVLKLDRSFIAQVEVPKSAAVISAVCVLGRNLGLKLVAEGVERRAQLDALRRMGFDLVQGYLISRPVPASAFEQMFSTLLL